MRGENVGNGQLDWSVDRRLPLVQAQEYADFQLGAGDIVIGMDRTFTKRGAKISRLRPCDIPCLLVQRVGRFVPRCDPDFLWQLLNSEAYLQALKLQEKGMDIPHLSREEILSPVVAIPPLPEQRAIAEALGDVDALIAAQQKLIAKKRAIKTATMQRLLTGKQRLPGFGEGCGYKQNEIGMIPEDWTVAPLMDAVRISSGQVNPSLSHLKDLILVAPDHLESGTGRLLTRVTAAQQGAVSGKYQFFSGDVLYSKIRPYLRKVTIANFDGLCSADMYPLSCEPSKIVPEFLLGVLLSERFTSFAETVSARSGIPKINRDELAEFALSLPSVKEQRAIAEILTDMDAEITALEKRLSKSKNIKQGMMQELLTGRTRLV